MRGNHRVAIRRQQLLQVTSLTDIAAVGARENATGHVACGRAPAFRLSRRHSRRLSLGISQLRLRLPGVVYTCVYEVVYEQVEHVRMYKYIHTHNMSVD